MILSSDISNLMLPDKNSKQMRIINIMLQYLCIPQWPCDTIKRGAKWTNKQIFIDDEHNCVNGSLTNKHPLSINHLYFG